ncbi:peptide chain release factor 2 [Brevibacillus laterosporus]|nr:peptide chain release factor 2 [Brevibacillus laterosporus]AYB40816.1 peptide chain release factor 2 [Brevibacillus laterosporus]NKQ22460.1 peptide chain release factor 2 [Brevibacillus laterosporus]TPH19878.1 peptide chain release factor 2 [Brevibacillus laterosporus]
MALIDVADVKQEMASLSKRLADIRGSLDLPEKLERIGELEERMLAPDFWDDNDAAQKTIGELNGIKSLTDTMGRLDTSYDDLQMMLELVIEEGDSSLISDLYESTQELKKTFEDFELELLLSDQYDKNNAILELHPGAGGTESQDWGSMLLRMYTRWAERKGFKVETLDYLPGDEAGIKSVTLLIKGHNAYGYLKAEKGVHRLVRISPFDSSGRRHTSFVSCNVLPEIGNDKEVDIRTEDLKIDTYRASGAGGQHINTTDSAVRITHLPTGIVVTCQAERSQIKNRDRAMKMLLGKLFELQKQEQEKTLASIQGEQKDIAWGSQIRSYVFHPYSMVKDHRTNMEIGNVQAVMDGELDPFIDAYLRFQLQ